MKYGNELEITLAIGTKAVEIDGMNQIMYLLQTWKLIGVSHIVPVGPIKSSEGNKERDDCL